MTDYTARTARILTRLDALAAISDDADGVTRTFGSPAFVRGRALVQGWMEEAGLQTRLDALGNLRGQLPSAAPGARSWTICSIARPSSRPAPMRVSAITLTGVA